MSEPAVTAQRGKVCERSVYTPGAELRVYRRRADGFRRIELEVFDEATVTLYLTGEEFAKWEKAFSPEPTPETAP